MKIAIPQMGRTVAPCLEYCATMALFTIQDGSVTERVEFHLSSREPLDRVRLLRDQSIDTIICGGVQDVLEDILRASGIQVISWVSGTVDDLLEAYLTGNLAAGPARGAQFGSDSLREQDIAEP